MFHPPDTPTTVVAVALVVVDNTDVDVPTHVVEVVVNKVVISQDVVQLLVIDVVVSVTVVHDVVSVVDVDVNESVVVV